MCSCRMVDPDQCRKTVWPSACSGARSSCWGLLLTVGIVAWVQTFRALEFEPRAVQSAQQIASLVNLSRAALRYADSINRVTLIKAMFDQESITLKPASRLTAIEPV
jgi:two-component system osmolarity sensor histidine kinase EnvZ